MLISSLWCIPIQQPLARAFFAEIVGLHGLPVSIVSDRDPVLTFNFWRDLFAMCGSNLHMSTAFHPQSDGQSEAVNKTIAIAVNKTIAVLGA